MKFQGLCLAVVLLSAVTMSSCATRTVKREVHRHDGVVATLRHQTESGVVVDRGFEHPIEISHKKLRTILAGILIRDKTAGVKPAVDGVLIPRVAKGLAQALGQANASEEVALTSIRRARRLGIFSIKFLTSLVAYVEDDKLILSFSYVDWDLDRDKSKRTKVDRLPQPYLGDEVMDFTVMAGDGFEVVGKRAVKIALGDARWGDLMEPKATDTETPEPAAEPEPTPIADEAEVPLVPLDPTQ